uniref:Uncharacterized protein n=1 Tax=Cucumis melo TaxID=3656 RepID=A0A9I9CUW2_CUCME
MGRQTKRAGPGGRDAGWSVSSGETGAGLAWAIWAETVVSRALDWARHLNDVTCTRGVGRTGTRSQLKGSRRVRAWVWVNIRV